MDEIKSRTGDKRKWVINHRVYDLLLIVVLLLGAYFRFVGIYWGEYQYLHPDERFLVWVGTDINPVESFSEYFDAANSSLNPNNRGHTFYVYGTLPLFAARYLVESIFGHSGFMEMTQVGRPLSAIADLLTVLLVYLLGSRLYDKRVGLFGAAFSAAAVLQIQQSHFFTMDTFITFFTFLAIYFAARVLKDGRYWMPGRTRNSPGSEDAEEGKDVPGAETFEPVRSANLTLNDRGDMTEGDSSSLYAAAGAPATTQPSRLVQSAARFVTHPLFWSSVLFGAALGCAVASKINALPVAIMLPLAMGLRLFELPSEEREQHMVSILGYLILAAMTSLVVFRIFQPYAFSGPGFFGLELNPMWLQNMRELRAGSSGDIDYPFALQWARRPVWFSGQNMLLWGLGIPLGITAWLGFIWVGWRILKGAWKTHLFLWAWVAFYFTWQSLAFNPTMRYQLPVYPALAIFAGWLVVSLWDKVPKSGGIRKAGWNVYPLLAVLVGIAVLATTFGWAYAFTRIYTRPITRVEASRWIYQNIPGAVNLNIETQDGRYNQPLFYSQGQVISPDAPYMTTFTAYADGFLNEVQLGHLFDQSFSQEPLPLSLIVSTDPEGSSPLARAATQVTWGVIDPTNPSISLVLDQPVSLTRWENYYLILMVEGADRALAVRGPINLNIQVGGGGILQTLPYPMEVLRSGAPYTTNFKANTDGELTEITLGNIIDRTVEPARRSFEVNIFKAGETAALAAATMTFIPEQKGMPTGGTGEAYVFKLDQSIPVKKGEQYTLQLSLLSGEPVSLQASGVANESDFDDGLPLRLDGYDGIYPPGLNFQMYWPENVDKLVRFMNTMDQSNYILMTSSRQWGSIPRVPERYPMSAIYYRELLGCPEDKSIEWCYNVAAPGTFEGRLGFELVKVFQSDPKIGSLTINDQPSEEAFTVYDHPKVFVFEKTADYSTQKVFETLGAVDFSRVIHLTPKKADSHPADLMLPGERLAMQRQGGTWSELFDTENFYNRYPALGVATWYLGLGLLGFLAYPILRLALPGLADRGYPLARIAGLLILSYLVWVGGSAGIPVTRTTITYAVLLLAVIGLALAFWQRAELWQELRQKRNYFLLVEGLFLAFFLLDLLIRYGNPDLWHPWKGGEKPMDFSYFNAILKSTSFPPYDPWFAGGYLNYYYYGFVLVGMLVKWLGIVPAVAYNLILPSLFAMIALGAFSGAWNLSGRVSAQSKWIAGIAGAVSMALLGNLGTVRMILLGYQRLAAPGGVLEGAGFITRAVWSVQGLFLALGGNALPYGLGDWYWIPSRAIPPQGDVEPITEFPFFTVLYGDLHAHLVALPVALLALGWAISVVLGRARWQKPLGVILGLFIGGLSIGALYPINLSDIYTYLPLGLVALGYAIWRYYRPENSTWLPGLPPLSRRTLTLVGAVAALALLSIVLYTPYSQWYGQAYGSVQLWRGPRTPLTSYLTHWGLFLFVFVSWMLWETREWMASTPLSSLRKLEPYRDAILGLVLLLFAAMAAYQLWTTSTHWFGISIVWLALPLAVWAGILLLRPGMPDARRMVLFLFGTGLLITIMVETVVVRGDIGRMNTVFKFYLQVWTLFAVGGAAALVWLLSALPRWNPGWRLAWQLPLIVLVFSAGMFTLLGGTAKVKDRMAPQAPHTLNGMTYMQYATYDDLGNVMDLSQDYNAIRWLQENVEGSPVIVEANSRRLYQWFTRYTINTGLPNVVGWEWHQQQQRALVSGNWVSQRLTEVDRFYQTSNPSTAQDFLRAYDVRYIVLGQLERINYPGRGLDKFSEQEGILWDEVYRDQDTVIYQVNPSSLSSRE